jgi:hypothetical protein
MLANHAAASGDSNDGTAKRHNIYSGAFIILNKRSGFDELEHY